MRTMCQLTVRRRAHRALELSTGNRASSKLASLESAFRRLGLDEDIEDWVASESSNGETRPQN